jgi:hypothetical protein
LSESAFNSVLNPRCPSLAFAAYSCTDFQFCCDLAGWIFPVVSCVLDALRCRSVSTPVFHHQDFLGHPFFSVLRSAREGTSSCFHRLGSALPLSKFFSILIFLINILEMNPANVFSKSSHFESRQSVWRD